MKASLFSLPALLATIAFCLLFVGACTRVWIGVDSNLTPGVVDNGTNNTSGTPGYVYPSHFGLWTGCYEYTSTGEQFGCAYITASCNTNLCYFVGDELYCAATRYGAIDNCAAFISARSFMVIAMIFLCSAMVMLLSGLKYSAADKMSVGFLWTTVVFESITMGCIIGGVYHGTGEGPATTYTVQDNFHLDWSFICFGVAFGLTFLAAIAATGFVAVAPKDEVHFDTPCPNEKPLDV